MKGDIPMQVNISLTKPMNQTTAIGNLNFSEDGLKSSVDGSSDHPLQPLTTTVYIYVGNPRDHTPHPAHITPKSENIIYIFQVTPFKDPIFSGFIQPSLLLASSGNLNIYVYDDSYSFERPEKLIYHLHRARICKLNTF
jgi:hypothetical protein